MRQILYRGKRLDTGEWVYGDLVHGLNDVRIHVPPTEPEHGIHIIDSETLGQLMPHLSADEAPVYEGDIVDYPGHVRGALRSVVVWNDEAAAFQLNLADHEYGRGWAKVSMVKLMCVVGDVHTDAGKLEI